MWSTSIQGSSSPSLSSFLTWPTGASTSWRCECHTHTHSPELYRSASTLWVLMVHTEHGKQTELEYRVDYGLHASGILWSDVNQHRKWTFKDRSLPEKRSEKICCTQDGGDRVYCTVTKLFCRKTGFPAIQISMCRTQRSFTFLFSETGVSQVLLRLLNFKFFAIDVTNSSPLFFN